MMNPFDQFSNVIPNSICNFLPMLLSVEFPIPLFMMSYLWIYDTWGQMDCTIFFFSKNTSSMLIFKSWWICLHTFRVNSIYKKTFSTIVSIPAKLNGPLWQLTKFSVLKCSMTTDESIIEWFNIYLIHLVEIVGKKSNDVV